MKFLALAVCLPALLAAQDAREIARRAIDAEFASVLAGRNYNYVERQATKQFNGSGKLEKFEAKTWDVTMVEGSPYRRLVGLNDKPLAAPDQNKEDEKLHWFTEQRHAENSDQRQLRIADWKHKQDKQREPLHEILDGFNFKLLPDETVNGRAVWLVEATPKPGYKPKSKSAFFFPKVRMRLWVDRQDFQAVKAEMELLDSVWWNGIVARLPKGDRLTYELTRVDGNVWLPERIRITGSARVLFVKGFHGEIEIDYSNYKRVTP